ncbi:hypothetical protein J6590_074615 [Homalodisca vitripennis]|nr:hypothetical protein J6590_074615 [Homalodisca vitripennis]
MPPRLLLQATDCSFVFDVPTRPNSQPLGDSIGKYIITPYLSVSRFKVFLGQIFKMFLGQIFSVFLGQIFKVFLG